MMFTKNFFQNGYLKIGITKLQQGIILKCIATLMIMRKEQKIKTIIVRYGFLLAKSKIAEAYKSNYQPATALCGGKGEFP